VNKTHQDTTPPELSRRSLLQGAAGAGLAATVAVAGVTALGATASAVTSSATSSAADPAANNTVSDHANASAPLVVHVRDIKTGDIEVFSGTSQTRVRDRALAARIAQAIN
jgi:hypothetical protein